MKFKDIENRVREKAREQALVSLATNSFPWSPGEPTDAQRSAYIESRESAALDRLAFALVELACPQG